MTATSQPKWAPASGWGAGRIITLVLGSVLLLAAAGLLVGGGVLLWADLGNRTDGFVFSEADGFWTDGYALSSERLDLSTGADWVPLSATLGTARVEVTSTGAAADVFIGLAPAAEGAAYLDGVEHSVINDLGTTAVDEVRVPGGEPLGPPGEQDFWVAQASGPETQRLDWEPAEGDWLFVVMNADGSAGVSVDARVGATVPALGGLAWGMLGTGLLLLVIGVLLVVLAIRRRPAQYVGPPIGGRRPPPWTRPLRSTGAPPPTTSPGATSPTAERERRRAPGGTRRREAPCGGQGVPCQMRALRSLRRIFPAADFGTASMNSTNRIFLCGATFSAM
jgi:hypothetical protein